MTCGIKPMFEAIQRTELCETCRVTPDLVSQYQVGMEQLVHLVWERTTKRHTTEKAPGKKQTPPHKLSNNSAPLKHVENVVRLETSTREAISSNPSNTRIPTAGVSASLES